VLIFRAIPKVTEAAPLLLAVGNFVTEPMVEE
jgi:hypothetical protein